MIKLEIVRGELWQKVLKWNKGFVVGRKLYKRYSIYAFSLAETVRFTIYETDECNRQGRERRLSPLSHFFYCIVCMNALISGSMYRRVIKFGRKVSV